MSLLAIALTVCLAQQRTTPGTTWETRTPAQAGLDAAKLDQVKAYLGGRGFISRHGYQVYTWGDVARRADIASAAKPIYAHFLFKAVEEGRLANADVKASVWDSRLTGKNANITFRHFANQTSCYGVTENPGAAFDYNDWQMALFWDTLFLKVYGSTLSNVDGNVLRPRLATPLGCQDTPTFLAFGTSDRPGRVAISVRDHARFGLLYQRTGDWGGTRLLSQANSTAAVASPLPLSIPRTAGVAAPMLSGQRTIGSSTIPDNQTDHHGSYSWLWWVNGVKRDGRRFWPDAPTDVYASLGHANGKRGVAVMPSQEIVIAWNDTTLDQKPSDPHPLNEVFKLLAQAVQAAPDPLVADGPWLRYANGPRLFMAGPGDPEGFLYRTDQAALIDKMKGTGANCIYMQAVRSHGGDGGANENPFVGGNPANGLDAARLDQWETWFTEMDDAGIVIYFFFYDDGARIWTGDTVGAAERAFLDGLVNRFKHHRNLIWCVAEEYSEAYSATRVKNIAAAVRAADDRRHPIAVHKLGGLSFTEFADDPNIDQFAIQYNVATPGELHAGMLTAWSGAAGKYNLNMSEAANHGTGTTARKKDWACAMGGAYVMRLGMDIATSTTADLADCGRLVKFMSMTDFYKMAPHDELRFGGTEYVLALPGDTYIAYASALSGSIGLRAMTSGTYSFTWFDCVNGAQVNQTNVSVAAGDRTWARPSGIGPELAVWVKRTGGTANAASTANGQSVTVPHNTAKAITLSYSDPDGPGPHTVTIVSGPSHGTLTGTGTSRTYTPSTGYSGADAFTWKVHDGLATSNTATVSITVQAATNAAPVASNQSVATPQGQPVTFILSYTDPDGPGPYAVTILTQPSNGALTGTGNDRTYAPASGFTGTDQFTWRVSDGLANSNTATVTISVTAGGIGGTSPTSYVWDTLDVGKLQYVDRTFTFSGVPASMTGLPYLRTKNDDKAGTGNVSFTVDRASTVYVAHDDRITTRPSWMSGFVNTGLDLVSGGGTFSLWSKDVAAGTVVLGPNGGTTQSMYTVVVRLGTGSTAFALSIQSVSTGRAYALSTAKAGALYYIDRSYSIASLSSALNNQPMIRTANDDKSVSSASHLTFTMSGSATVYVGFDKRATSTPGWLSGWTLSSETLAVSDAGASPMRVYAKAFPAGSVTLGGNQPSGAGSHYVVIVKGSTSFARMLAVDEWDHPGDADGDGLFDAYELANGLDPAVADSDGDGDPDESELDGLGRTFWEAQAVAPAAADGDRSSGGSSCGLLGVELLLVAVWGVGRNRNRA